MRSVSLPARAKRGKNGNGGARVGRTVSIKQHLRRITLRNPETSDRASSGGEPGSIKDDRHEAAAAKGNKSEKRLVSGNERETYERVPTRGTVMIHPRKIHPRARQLVARTEEGRRVSFAGGEREEKGHTVAVAKRDSESGARNAHGSGDGNAVLRSEDDGDGGAWSKRSSQRGVLSVNLSSKRTELHGESTRRRHEGDLVTEDGHDVVAVWRRRERQQQSRSKRRGERTGSESNHEHGSTEGEDPDGDGTLGSSRVSSRPDLVDDGVGTDGVGDIVGWRKHRLANRPSEKRETDAPP